MTRPRRSWFVRRFPLMAGTFVVLVVAAHTALWVFATGRIEDALAVELTQLRAAGWTATAGPPERSGWPMEAAVVLPDVALAGGMDDLPGGLAWRVDRLRVSVAFLEPRLLRVRAVAGQRLRLGPLPEVGLTAERLEATVPLQSGGAVESADLAGSAVHVAVPDGDLGIATLSAHVDFHSAAPQGTPVLALTASAEAIALPAVPGRSWALGGRIASVSFDAALSGPVLDTPDLLARAAGWRDGGGSLALRRLALGWGPLGLSGTATLGLDANLQPAGTARARMVGYDATLDALATAGLLTPKAAQAAKAVLGILARPPEGGGAPQVEVPLTLEDRKLAVGGFPLLRLPQWVWQ